MLKYTTSSIRDTYDFIKQAIFIFDTIFQVFYIGYLIFRIWTKTGFLALNIILLTITLFYFVYNLVTNREFYTDEQKKQRSVIRNISKIIKRLVNFTVIGLAVYRLYIDGSQVDNITMLLTVIMILGFVFSVVFDLLIMLIDRRSKLIEASIYYDAELFRENHALITKFLRMNKVDIEEIFPSVTNPKMVEKIKETNHRQESKRLRKIDFKDRYRLPKKKK